MGSSETAKIDSLAPSAKLVVKVLEYEGPLTQKELIRQSHLSSRTVRNALNQLERIDMVEKGICIDDARQNSYQLVSDGDLVEQSDD
ncbi:ArsR family transcriptional regulator [Halococcus morrhuae DSM 1307]|uniref:ArsR family transcriptional regulator n=1 Tax=Halococcus morrhuae DSM 1307 TaxID=931277 RepID=M0MIR7_HALMO|nr:helix-turn-helix domain-containing protein [Halococcus morrhuae]EMA44619.1 ArsR family transcriptional regulator [Halococcus morrhuae DSM 1307]